MPTRLGLIMAEILKLEKSNIDCKIEDIGFGGIEY